MSSMVYRSFNELICEFLSELSQTFDDYPQLAEASEKLNVLVSVDDSITLPMEEFYKVFSDYSEQIMSKDPSVFKECVIPYTDGFDISREYMESDKGTQDAIWNYLQQLFVTATTVNSIPSDMMSNIESVANSCMEKVKSGEVTQEQSQDPMYIFQQLQQNEDLMASLQKHANQ